MIDPMDPTLPWRSVDRYLARFRIPTGSFPAVLHPPHTDPYMQTTGGVHASNSLHPRGLARDYSAGQGADVAAILKALLPIADGRPRADGHPRVWVHQLFYTPADVFLQDGHRVPADVIRRQNLDGIHRDHLHVGLFEHVLLDDAP